MFIHIMLISFTFGQYNVKLIVTYRLQIAQSGKLGGFIGEKLDLSYQKRVLAQNVGRQVSPFRNRTETSCWQSEFWGKYLPLSGQRMEGSEQCGMSMNFQQFYI
ncbi:MAG: hypothetical protein ACYC25_10905 [Paludibacter sp.]